MVSWSLPIARARDGADTKRSWVSPPVGSLLCSILLRPELPVDQLYNLTSVVALAARRACVGFGGTDVTLKWPNDLVTPAGKLAGVLAELVISTRHHRSSSGSDATSTGPRGGRRQMIRLVSAELVKDATTLEQSCGRQIPAMSFSTASSTRSTRSTPRFLDLTVQARSGGSTRVRARPSDNESR